MFETWLDVVRYAAAGAVGGAIYWAARTHGQVFAELWTLLSRR